MMTPAHEGMETAGMRTTRWLWVGVAAATLLCSRGAYGQLGYFGRPSQFSTPLSGFGSVGGTYTRSTGSGYQSQRSAGGYNNPLSVDLGVRGMSQAGAANIIGAQRQTPYLGSVTTGMTPFATSMYSPYAGTMPLSHPYANRLPLGQPAARVQSVRMFSPQRLNMFDAAINTDSMNQVPSRLKSSLADITPSGPSVTAATGVEAPGPVEPDKAAQHAAATTYGATLKEMTRMQASRLTHQGDASLDKAMAALRQGKLRGDLSGQGAIDYFRQARLLLGQQPEPVLGLVASLVRTGDYSQAAALMAPLARRWPEVFASRQFAAEFYDRPDLMRTNLLQIRQAVATRNEANLQLLYGFYRWHLENPQLVAAEVERIARAMGDDSAAAAMLQAMRAAQGARG